MKRSDSLLIVENRLHNPYHTDFEQRQADPVDTYSHSRNAATSRTATFAPCFHSAIHFPAANHATLIAGPNRSHQSLDHAYELHIDGKNLRGR